MNRNILIVEDEIIIARDIKSILQGYGYENIQIATSYKKAQSIILTDIPALIISDIYLKGEKTGIDFITEVHHVKIIPVLYVSAFSDNETLTKAFKSKPVSYITKPFTKIQLLAAVKLALNSSIDTAVSCLDVLTQREKEIVNYIASGMSSKQIAEEISRSYDTINNHKRNIFKKLEIHKISELINLSNGNF